MALEEPPGVAAGAAPRSETDSLSEFERFEAQAAAEEGTAAHAGSVEGDDLNHPEGHGAERAAGRSPAKEEAEAEEETAAEVDADAGTQESRAPQPQPQPQQQQASGELAAAVAVHAVHGGAELPGEAEDGTEAVPEPARIEEQPRQAATEHTAAEEDPDPPRAEPAPAGAQSESPDPTLSHGETAPATSHGDALPPTPHSPAPIDVVSPAPHHLLGPAQVLQPQSPTASPQFSSPSPSPSSSTDGASSASSGGKRRRPRQRNLTPAQQTRARLKRQQRQRDAQRQQANRDAQAIKAQRTASIHASQRELRLQAQERVRAKRLAEARRRAREEEMVREARLAEAEAQAEAEAEEEAQRLEEERVQQQAAAAAARRREQMRAAERKREALVAERDRQRTLRQSIRAAVLIQKVFRGWAARCQTRAALVARRDQYERDAELAERNARQARNWLRAASDPQLGAGPVPTRSSVAHSLGVPQLSTEQLQLQQRTRYEEAAVLEHHRGVTMRKRAERLDRVLQQTYAVPLRPNGASSWAQAHGSKPLPSIGGPASVSGSDRGDCDSGLEDSDGPWLEDGAGPESMLPFGRELGGGARPLRATPSPSKMGVSVLPPISPGPIPTAKPRLADSPGLAMFESWEREKTTVVPSFRPLVFDPTAAAQLPRRDAARRPADVPRARTFIIDKRIG